MANVTKVLKGVVADMNLTAEGHSNVRIRVKGFGEVILSAPRAQLMEFVAVADGEATVTIEAAPPEAAG